MIQFLRSAVVWLFSFEPHWFQANGWINESFAGLLGGLTFSWLYDRATGVKRRDWGALIDIFAAFNTVSVVYELFIDPHGWSIADVSMRIPALIVGMLIWRMK